MGRAPREDTRQRVVRLMAPLKTKTKIANPRIVEWNRTKTKTPSLEWNRAPQDTSDYHCQPTATNLALFFLRAADTKFLQLGPVLCYYRVFFPKVS